MVDRFSDAHGGEALSTHLTPFNPGNHLLFSTTMRCLSSRRARDSLSSAISRALGVANGLKDGSDGALAWWCACEDPRPGLQAFALEVGRPVLWATWQPM